MSPGTCLPSRTRFASAPTRRILEHWLGSLLAATSLSVSFVGCQQADKERDGTVVASITAGTIDQGDPAVGAMGPSRQFCGDVWVPSCTGSLIAPNVVLTAGHCVGWQWPRVSLVFGEKTGAVAEENTVVAARVHPDFDDDAHANDLALLQLERPVAIRPVALHRGVLDQSFVGVRARIVGFGVTEAGGLDVGTKREGSITISSVEETSFHFRPTPSMICNGDSGGPIFAMEGEKEVLIGVTSWGDLGCAEDGVGTAIGAYLETFVVGFLEDASKAPPRRESGPIAHVDICTQECTSTNDCPTGFNCEEDSYGTLRCLLAPLPAGNFGPICGTGGDCRTGKCASVPSQGCLCYDPCAQAFPSPDSGTSTPTAGGRPLEVTGGCGLVAGDRHARNSAVAVGGLAFLVWAQIRSRKRVGMRGCASSTSPVHLRFR